MDDIAHEQAIICRQLFAGHTFTFLEIYVRCF